MIDFEDIIFAPMDLLDWFTDLILGDEENDAVITLVITLLLPLHLLAIVLTMCVVGPIAIVGCAMWGVVVVLWRLLRRVLP